MFEHSLQAGSLLHGCLYLTKKKSFDQGKDIKVTLQETCAYIMSAGDFSFPDSTKVPNTTALSCSVMVKPGLLDIQWAQYLVISRYSIRIVHIVHILHI
jgi:hypothetical protein